METIDRIKQQVSENPILIYMKGTPQMPMCGFSSRTIEVLKSYGKEFAYVNIIADPEVHRTLPQFSNWPTFPQVFVGGELIGGCDITLEMHERGELEAVLEAAST